MAERTCSVDGCPKKARSRGWCSAHYERWRRTGVVGGADDLRRRPLRECEVDGCTYVGRLARGWCPKHYMRWRQHGDPTVMLRQYGEYRRIRRDGYVAIWNPKHPLASSTGYVAEHRMVAWDHGILTDPDDHVHHRNHDRQDNRPENLEAVAPDEHARRHAEEAGTITNQYGTWPLRRLTHERLGLRGG